MPVKLVVGGQPLDMKGGTRIESEETSPIYNDEGTHTASISVPDSPRNRKLLSYPYRLDTAGLRGQGEDIVFEDGALVRPGKLNILSASSKGYELNIGFTEGKAYSDFNSVKLKEIPNLPVYTPEGGLSELVSHLDAVRKGEEIADYIVFQILVAWNEKEETVTEGDTEKEVKKWYPELLNKLNGTDLISAARTETYLINDEATDVTLPVGYGITPFIRVHVLLNLMFEAYGYTVVENPFADHFQLRELVVLNNVADAIVKGSIDYVDMMPDCTINEFLQALKCRFGMYVFIDDERQVHLKLIRDILASNVRTDLTEKCLDDYTIEYSEPEQLVLRCQTNLTQAAPSVETLEEFMTPHHNMYSNIQGTEDAMYYDRASGHFIKRKGSTYTLLSNDLFPWKKEGTLTEHSIDSVDEAIPMHFSSSYRYWNGVPAYLVGSVKKYTTLITSSVEVSEGEIPETPLAFLFGYNPFGYMGITHSTEADGTKRMITINGEYVALPYDLTFTGEYGHFMQFWRSFDAVLRHSNYVVNSQLQLSASELVNLPMWKQVRLHGQPMQIDRFTFISPLEKKIPIEASFRTLRLYEPYDLDAEQLIELEVQKYYWLIGNTQESVVAAREAELEEQVTEELEEGTVWFSHCESEVEAATLDIFDDAGGFVPPTDHEYEVNKRIVVQLVDITITTKVYTKTPTASGGWDVTLYNTYTIKTLYEVYITPAKVTS